MQNLSHYITHPTELSYAEMEALDTLSKKFPYFQAAHILLARAGKNDNAFSYNKHLKMAGLYAGDRRVLYEFMHHQVLEQPELIDNTTQDNSYDNTIIEKPTSEPVIINYPFTSEDEKLPKLEVKEHQPIFRLIAEPEQRNEAITEEILNSDSTPVNTDNVAPSLLFEPELPIKIEQNQEVEIENPEPIETELAEIEEIDTHDLNSSENIEPQIIEETIETVAETEPEFQRNELPEIETETFENFLKPLESTITNETIPEIESISESKEQQPIDTDLDFFSWLDNIIPETKTNPIIPIEEVVISEKSPEIVEEALEAIHQISETDDQAEVYAPSDLAEIAYDIQAFVKSSVPDVPKKAPEKPSKSDIDSLLDRFIQKNPSISKPKAEIYKPENMAKKSEEFHVDIASETLANLFYKQGLLHKALEVYEKLMLQKPEKNEIFATRIKSIKEELINRL